MFSSTQIRSQFQDFVRSGARHFSSLIVAHEAQSLSRQALTAPQTSEQTKVKLRHSMQELPT